MKYLMFLVIAGSATSALADFNCQIEAMNRPARQAYGSAKNTTLEKCVNEAKELADSISDGYEISYTYLTDPVAELDGKKIKITGNVTIQ